MVQTTEIVWKSRHSRWNSGVRYPAILLGANFVLKEPPWLRRFLLISYLFLDAAEYVGFTYIIGIVIIVAYLQITGEYFVVYIKPNAVGYVMGVQFIKQLIAVLLKLSHSPQ